ncbi:MAG TPA: RnfABCDGE type electron transport complex subunit B [Spirochaetota bacterium]|nr:RnfABCDGE type electron transport complex subunit B [Spirochaetota bacterium]HPI88243.1 RnfABCDGE type electron transport complex subunit B [Spirochaetota bacterium]HPR47213.1 RnfABCDGE type electron transport complex subunit B [Spirochaetota bacterium]
MLDYIFPSLPAVLSLSLLGVAFGLILSVAKIKLHVERDPRIELVLGALPGANCGACGMPGCSAYATKIVEDKFEINLCPVGGADAVAKIAEIMGVAAEGAGPSLIARVHCQGGVAETAKKFIYEGPKTCSAAQGIMGGFKVCEYGCLGLGDCVTACPFDAIHMGEKGLPVVDREKCVGCGKCATACPRGVISLVPAKFKLHVLCRNREKAPVMKKGCPVGCIGCKLCEKACKEIQIKPQTKKNPDLDPADVIPAITVDSFCASIDYNICINCLKCVQVCPVPVIEPVEKSNKFKEAHQTAESSVETVSSAEA